MYGDLRTNLGSIKAGKMAFVFRFLSARRWTAACLYSLVLFWRLQLRTGVFSRLAGFSTSAYKNPFRCGCFLVSILWWNCCYLLSTRLAEKQPLQEFVFLRARTKFAGESPNLPRKTFRLSTLGGCRLPVTWVNVNYFYCQPWLNLPSSISATQCLTLGISVSRRTFILPFACVSKGFVLFCLVLSCGTLTQLPAASYGSKRGHLQGLGGRSPGRSKVLFFPFLL